MTSLTDADCDHVIDLMERQEWTGLSRDDVRLWARAIDDARLTDQPDAVLAKFAADLAAAQKPMDPEAARVLYANLDELYITDPTSAGRSGNGDVHGS